MNKARFLRSRAPIYLSVLASPLLMTGCVNSGERATPEYPPNWAQAQIHNANGALVGVAQFSQYDSGVLVVVDGGLGLPSGAHGLHIHEVGRCDAPDFETAGSHWNPKGRKHGLENPKGHHAGDLPNLVSPGSPSGTQHMIKNARIATGRVPILDKDGAAIVIHESADDAMTDPSGNSGARLACGVIELTHP